MSESGPVNLSLDPQPRAGWPTFLGIYVGDGQVVPHVEQLSRRYETEEGCQMVIKLSGGCQMVIKLRRVAR